MRRFVFVLIGMASWGLWSEMTTKEIPYGLRVHAYVEVTSVAFRPYIVPATFVAETECGTRRFYVAPWISEFTAEVSAYNSEVGQTDADPWIAANNRPVFDGGIATNALPCGSKVMFPDLFGDRVFTVNDRMNRRYHPLRSDGQTVNVDVWMADRQEALKLGRIGGIRAVIVEYSGV